jgi:hypothetical protein
LFGYFVFKFQGTHNLEADINDTKKRKENWAIFAYAFIIILIAKVNFDVSVICFNLFDFHVQD